MMKQKQTVGQDKKKTQKLQGKKKKRENSLKHGQHLNRQI